MVARMKAERTINVTTKFCNHPSRSEIGKVETLPADHEIAVYGDDSGWRKYELVHIIDSEDKLSSFHGIVLSLPVNVVLHLHLNGSSNAANAPEETKTDDVHKRGETIRAGHEMIKRSRK